MLDNDRNSAATSVRAVLQRRETPTGASETPIARLARTRVSLRMDCAFAVLAACQGQYDKGSAQKIVVDWPPNALRDGPHINISQSKAK